MKKQFFSNKTTFSERVRDIVKNIKKGSVMTYGQVASLAGSSGAARAVGTVMKNNYNSEIPCHRVVGSHGQVGDYNRGGRTMKIKILKEEGVQFTKSGRVIL